MSDEQTIAAYNRKSAEYAELAKTDQAQNGLDEFLRHVPSDGLILDLGCGPGHTAAEMLRRGYRIEAIDASPEMARLAKENHGLDVRISDFAAIDAVEHYNGVWASFSLLHAPREQFPILLGRMARALTSGGALFLGMKLGSGAERDALGRHYTYYTRDELVEFLDVAGFEVLTETLGEGMGLAGHVEPWLTILAVRTT
ncbi:MAG: class I SAM-dependent methyltransferase [Pseudomonadota bacterium]